MKKTVFLLSLFCAAAFAQASIGTPSVQDFRAVVAENDLVERDYGFRQQAPPPAWSF
jgi:hypothetical protein